MCIADDAKFHSRSATDPVIAVMPEMKEAVARTIAQCARHRKSARNASVCQCVFDELVPDLCFPSAGNFFTNIILWIVLFPSPPLDNIRVMMHDCLEVKREYYQNSSVLDCVTQCSQSAAHLYEQFLQVKQIGFVTLGPLRYV